MTETVDWNEKLRAEEEALDAKDPHHAKMRKAWALVSPKDWRDPVDWRASEDVVDRVLVERGLKLDDVAEAISYFTATDAKIVRRNGLIIVTAVGYRNGPAGP